MKKYKPKVKLLTKWMSDYDNPYEKPNEDYISKGIWEARGVEEKSNSQRIYTLVCIASHHKNLKIGDTRTMDEVMIIELCHRVKLVKLSKYKSIIRRNY